MGHKVRSWMLIGIPLLVLIAAIGATLALLEPPEVKPEKQLTAKEVASKLLPNMDKEIKLASNPDIQVVEVSVHQEGSPRLVGIIHNSSAREVAEVQLVLDLTDTMGSQVGGVNGTVSNVPANGNKSFTIPIKQKDRRLRWCAILRRNNQGAGAKKDTGSNWVTRHLAPRFSTVVFTACSRRTLAVAS